MTRLPKRLPSIDGIERGSGKEKEKFEGSKEQNPVHRRLTVRKTQKRKEKKKKRMKRQQIEARLESTERHEARFLARETERRRRGKDNEEDGQRKRVQFGSV